MVDTPTHISVHDQAMIPMPETEDEETGVHETGVAETGVPDPNAAASAAATEWRRKHWNAENAAVDRVIAMLTDTKRADAGKAMETKKTWRDQKFALNMSVKKALAERGPQAKAAILAELGQLLKKKVWHPVSMATLSYAQQRTVLRSKMFLKDEFLSTGSFEKFKARLVAGEVKQDKGWTFEEIEKVWRTILTEHTTARIKTAAFAKETITWTRLTDWKKQVKAARSPPVVRSFKPVSSSSTNFPRTAQYSAYWPYNS